MALITAAQAREQIPGANTDDDTVISELINAVGGAFARWCGYPAPTPGAQVTLESASYTRYLTGRGGRNLVLDVWPVTGITTIEDDPTLDFDGSAYLVASTDYAIVDGRILRLKSTSTHGGWSRIEGAIKAVFTAGYGTIREELQHAARLAVRNAWDLRYNQGKASAGARGTSVTWRDEDFLPPVVTGLLGAYQLPRKFL